MTSPRDTRPWLVRRLAVLLTATALACGSLMTAYWGVSRGADAVPDRTAQAVGHVAATEKDLRESLKAAQAALSTPVDETVPATEGAGANYQEHINAAFRSLDRAAATTVTPSGRNVLETAAGQLSSYDYLIQQAARSHADEKLRNAYLRYADSTLTRDDSGVFARLAVVQARHARALKGQTEAGWLVLLAWGTAVALWAALTWLLIDAQLFLRRRFRRRFSGPLAGATLLVAVLMPLLLTAALRLQSDLRWAHGTLRGERRIEGLDPDTAHEHMTAPDWLTAVPTWIPLAAFVIAALIVLGLQPRIEEYRFARVPRSLGRRIRSFETGTVLLALWMVLFFAVSTSGPRSEHNGRISVLAPWTGAEEKRFKQLLNAYSAKYHVEVHYEGTTALREALISRLNSGNAPDVAILPSLGEVYAYVGSKPTPRELTPVLKGALKKYDPLWAPRFPGDKVYAVAVKADLKSIVWYDPARRRSGRWCAGMGGDATSGWPGTDWIEDILLQQSGKKVYEQWARGELPWSRGAVSEAWKAFGDVFTPSTATAALAQDFGTDLFKEPCTLQHQGSFIRTSDYTKRAGFLPTREVLPRIALQPPAYEVSADFATLFGKSKAAEDLMRFLADEEAQKAWAKVPDPKKGGNVSKAETEKTNPGRPFFVTRDAPQPAPEHEPLNARIGKALRDPQRPKCLDASDVMPLRMRFAFQHAVLDYLSAPGPDRQQKVLTYLESVRQSLGGAPRTAGSPPRVCE
ncbi:hypothetical protein [Streptomyces sp. URMC 124]|uniref:hypothetical protein n=1 Tax=Streptomyces sp. URMC 124 TaxID=3423405 RepID=UPI003F1D9E0A